MLVRLVSGNYIARALSSLEAARRLFEGVYRVEAYKCPCGCFGKHTWHYRLLLSKPKEPPPAATQISHPLARQGN